MNLDDLSDEVLYIYIGIPLLFVAILSVIAIYIMRKKTRQRLLALECTRRVRDINRKESASVVLIPSPRDVKGTSSFR